MTQIMQPGTAGFPGLSQPDAAAQLGECLAQGIGADSFALLTQEESARPERWPVLLPSDHVGTKSLTGGVMTWDEAGLAKLAVPHRNDPLLDIDIITVQSYNLTAAHAGYRQQAQNRRISERSDPPGQGMGRAYQDDDLVVTVDVGVTPASTVRQKAVRGHLVLWVNGTGVGRKVTDFREAAGSVGREASRGRVAHSSARSIVMCSTLYSSRNSTNWCRRRSLSSSFAPSMRRDTR